MAKHIYEIGGKKYRQEELVWGQVEQLLAVVKNIRLTTFTTPGIVAALGERIAEAVAVVLIPEGVDIKDKTRDIPTLADELRFGLRPEQIIQVVEDFFGCNPIPSLLERVSGAGEIIRAKFPAGALSNSLSAFSPEGISPAAMPSPGDSPPVSPSPTSATAAGS